MIALHTFSVRFSRRKPCFAPQKRRAANHGEFAHGKHLSFTLFSLFADVSHKSDLFLLSAHFSPLIEYIITEYREKSNRATKKILSLSLCYFFTNSVKKSVTFTAYSYYTAFRSASQAFVNIFTAIDFFIPPSHR